MSRDKQLKMDKEDLIIYNLKYFMDVINKCEEIINEKSKEMSNYSNLFEISPKKILLEIPEELKLEKENITTLSSGKKHFSVKNDKLHFEQ
jgi:hypothetical protein